MKNFSDSLKAAGFLGWEKRFDTLALFLFATGAMFLHGYNQLRALGVLLVLACLVRMAIEPRRSFKSLFSAPLEMYLFSAWVAWAGTSGVWAIDKELYLNGMKVLIQVLIMMWVVYVILRTTTHGERAVFLALIVGALIQLVNVYLELGGIRIPESMRIFGATGNPNALGFKMIWGSMGAIFFWGAYKLQSKNIRFLLLLCLVGFAFGILASASRKSAIAFAFLIFVWAVFLSDVRKSNLNLRKFAISGIMIVLGFVVVPFVMEETFLGKRFKAFYEAGEGSLVKAIERQSRYEMYVEGLKIFSEHPITGVGLDNFERVYYARMYSHSDYIEPLATTGIIGFILYQSVYFILLYRIFRLYRLEKDPLISYQLRVMFLAVITLMILGFGTPHHKSVDARLLLATFSAYTYGLWERVISEKSASRLIKAVAFPAHQVGREVSKHTLASKKKVY